MDFFKYFHFGLKNKYKYLLFGVVFSLLIFNFLSLFGYCFTYDGVIDNVTLNTSDKLITEGTNTIRYIRLTKGHKYRITNASTSNRYCALTKTVPQVGVSIFNLQTISSQGTIEILATDDYFLMLNTNFDYEDLGIQDYNGVMWALNENLSTDNIWTAFKNTIPYISVVIISCFGYLIISRSVDKFFINK